MGLISLSVGWDVAAAAGMAEAVVSCRAFQTSCLETRSLETGWKLPCPKHVFPLELARSALLPGPGAGAEWVLAVSPTLEMTGRVGNAFPTGVTPYR